MLAPARVRWAAHLEVGRQATQAHRLLEAEHAYRAAWQVAKRLGPRSPEVLESLKVLATHYRHAGDRRNAARTARRLLALQEAALGPRHPELVSTYELLTDVYTGWQPAEVERLYRRELALVEHAFGPNHWQVARVLSNFASHLSAHQRCGEAVALWQRALAILDRQRRRRSEPPAWGLHLTPALLGLALCHSRLGQHAEAERLYRRQLRRTARRRGPEDVSVSGVLFLVAIEVRAQGRPARAAALLRRAITLQDAWWGPREGSMPEQARRAVGRLRLGVLREYAAVLRELGRSQAAGAVETRIRRDQVRLGATDTASRTEPLTEQSDT